MQSSGIGVSAPTPFRKRRRSNWDRNETTCNQSDNFGDKVCNQSIIDRGQSNQSDNRIGSALSLSVII